MQACLPLSPLQHRRSRVPSGIRTRAQLPLFGNRFGTNIGDDYTFEQVELEQHERPHETMVFHRVHFQAKAIEVTWSPDLYETCPDFSEMCAKLQQRIGAKNDAADDSAADTTSKHKKRRLDLLDTQYGIQDAFAMPSISSLVDKLIKNSIIK
eukprot:SAG22_NODE_18_length_32591_cov_38.043549_20_plen_153_part_00